MTDETRQSFEDVDLAKYPGIEVAIQRAGIHPQEQGRIFEFLVSRAYSMLAGGTAAIGLAIPAGLATIDRDNVNALAMVLSSAAPIAWYLVFLSISLFALRLGNIRAVTEPQLTMDEFARHDPGRALMNLLGHLDKASKTNHDILNNRRRLLKIQTAALVALIVGALGWVVTVAAISAAAE